MTTDFRIDKDKLVEKFKSYLDQYVSDDEKEFQPKSAKETQYSKLDILRKVQKIYLWVLNNSLLNLRQMYIHDDEQFKNIKHSIESYISNKVRTRSDGQLYLNVPGLCQFSGDKEEYMEWIVWNKKNQERLIRKIIDELNNFISGNVEDDGGRPILNDDEYKILVAKNEDKIVCIQNEINEFMDEDRMSEYLVALMSKDSDKIEEIETALVEFVVERIDVSDTVVLGGIEKMKETYFKLENLENNDE